MSDPITLVVPPPPTGTVIKVPAPAGGVIIKVPDLIGTSAYQIAVKHGFQGTEQEWLESLKANGLTPEQAQQLIDAAIADIDIPRPDVNKAYVDQSDGAVAAKAFSDLEAYAASNSTTLTAYGEAILQRSLIGHTHTTAQVTGLDTALSGKAPTTHNHTAAQTTSGIFATARLGSGTASATTYLRGDGTWATIAADLASTGNRAITVPTIFSGGYVRMSRVGPLVTIALGGATFDFARLVANPGTSLRILGVNGIPVGFRPPSHTPGIVTLDNWTQVGLLVAFPGSDSAVLDIQKIDTTLLKANVNFRATIQFVTPDAWPSTLPGSPV